jgi:hypothetical protein
MTEPLLAAYEDGLQTLAKLDAMVLVIAKGRMRYAAAS